MDEYADNARKGVMDLIISSRQAAASKTAISQVDSTVSAESFPADDINVDITFLLSSSTIFACKHCPSATLRYPMLLDHRHGYPERWILSDFSFNVAATTMAETLLHSLQKHYEGDVTALRNQLQCLRCDENTSIPRDWTDLINHFTTEQQWYNNELQRKQSTASSTTLHDDHALDAAEPLVSVLSPAEAAKQKDRVQTWTIGIPRISTCKLCAWQRPKTRKEIELHLSRKHLKDVPGKDDIFESGPVFD